MPSTGDSSVDIAGFAPYGLEDPTSKRSRRPSCHTMRVRERDIGPAGAGWKPTLNPSIISAPALQGTRSGKPTASARTDLWLRV